MTWHQKIRYLLVCLLTLIVMWTVAVPTPEFQDVASGFIGLVFAIFIFKRFFGLFRDGVLWVLQRFGL